MDLFSQDNPSQSTGNSNVPFAERSRPDSLDEVVGHHDIIGPRTPLYRAIKSGQLGSIILWGPPGVGKTTLARVISHEVEAHFVSISAVTSGVADIRKTIERARDNRKYFSKPTILFIDEIHRFNKAQQDALLHVVEDGTISLIGATTENPSFEVISPLLSRCQVFQLGHLQNEDIRNIVEAAIKKDRDLFEIKVEIPQWEKLYIIADGDARRALNTVERALQQMADQPPPLVLTPEILEQAAQKKVLYYDKSGDYHYDLISAFIKSVRGSDPDAAVYWMARMLAAGEDPKFIARRMIILASEDVGNADPQALTIATSCFTAVTYIGMPECQLVLAQAVTYLAAAPKSNAAYLAIKKALRDVKEQPDVRVPLHLRNAPTGLMRDLDYGKDYQYAHDFEENFVQQSYLPPEHQHQLYYLPGINGAEKKMRERLMRLWGDLKQYLAGK